MPTQILVFIRSYSRVLFLEYWINLPNRLPRLLGIQTLRFSSDNATKVAGPGVYYLAEERVQDYGGLGAEVTTSLRATCQLISHSLCNPQALYMAADTK